MTQFPIFDGHNDTLLRLHMSDNAPSFFTESSEGHIDLPRAEMSGFGGGFCRLHPKQEL